MTSSAGLLVEKPRVSSIDLVRGAVMVIMALDHTRDFFHLSAFQFDPTDPTQTTPALFFTRWITHFCAPTFVFLSGTSIRLSLQRKSKSELSRFLLSRGLWLVFLEFTVVRFSIFFNLYYDATVVQVIYTIGLSMMIMAAMIHLKTRTILITGMVVTLGHNLLDPVRAEFNDVRFLVWHLIYQAGPVEVLPGKFWMVQYPFLPWLGIMMLGYGLGEWYRKEFNPEHRQKLLIRTGLAAIGLFILLRGFNVYGDPAPWTMQKNGLFTFLSFLNCTKYPVSLLYILMTLGPVMIVLGLLEKISTTRLKPIEVFGRVPMFYYIIHFYLIHLLALGTYLVVRHANWSDLNFYFIMGLRDGVPQFTGYFGGIPLKSLYTLPWVYVAWAVVIVIMYPLCTKYNAYKSTHTQWWLSYL